MKFDLAKSVKEAKGVGPTLLRSYFQLAGRNVIRILAKGPSPATAEEWAEEEITEGNPIYGEGGYLLLKVDPNQNDDFDVTNAIVIARGDKATLAVESIKLLDAIEAKHKAAG